MKNDVGQALYMTPEEKRISFMNRYFVQKSTKCEYDKQSES